MNKPRNIQQNLPLIISLLLIAAILIAYWQVKDFDFICFDDKPYVTENRHVQSGFTVKSIIWAFTTFDVSNWHPLTWLSHMADWELYGLNPMGHHWTSLQIHIANTLLLFFILQYMTGALWRSAFVAALFALHPLHVESVAWVAERKDVLSTFFGMLSLLAYCRYAKQPSLAGYLLVILFLSLGLMAKPMLVTFPFLLLLLDFWPLGRLRLATVSRLVLEKIPLLVPIVISSCLTFMAQQSGGAVKPLESFSLTVRIANAFVSYASYAVKAIWPHNLTVFYPHPGNTLPLWQVFGAILLVGGASFLAIRSLKKYPYIAVGLFWYLGMLVPVIGLVQVGPQAMADRYTYIPMTGLFIVITWGFSDLLTGRHYQKIVLALFAVIILSALTVSTFFQLGYWRNSVALFERAVNITENNCLAHNNLGTALLEKGKPDEAVLHLKEALRIEPGCRAALYNLGAALSAQGKLDEAVLHYNNVLKINPKDAIVHNNLADALSAQGKLDEAVLHYNKALKIDPDYAGAHGGFGSLLIKQNKFKEAMFHLTEAIRINPDYAEAYNNIGVVFSRLNKFKEASTFFSKAIQVKPDFTEARNGLGYALAQQGNVKGAFYHYYEALRINPNYAGAYFNLGKIYANQGKIGKAIINYRKALRINPNMTQTLYNLSWIEATCENENFRNSIEAVGLAEKLCDLTGYSQPLALDALAAAYAEAGRFDEAVATAQKALKLVLDNGPKELALNLKKRLRLFQAGHPYREGCAKNE